MIEIYLSKDSKVHTDRLAATLKAQYGDDAIRSFGVKWDEQRNPVYIALELNTDVDEKAVKQVITNYISSEIKTDFDELAERVPLTLEALEQRITALERIIVKDGTREG